jgi:hypothetical protein
MTLEQIEAMDTNTLTVAQVAEFLGCDPQLIRDEASKEPRHLGFMIAKIGRSYKIPRIAFINWAKGNVPVMKWLWTWAQMNELYERGVKDCP